MVTVPSEQIPGVYHRRIGDIVVTAVSDGYLDGSMAVLNNISVEHGTQMMTDAFRPARRTSVNTFIIHSGGKVGVIDTGSGTYMGPTAGWQIGNMKEAGVDPSEVDAVMLTHMHPDHSAGLSDRESNSRFFANAELLFNEKELAHWQDDGAMARATDREKALYFQCAREQVAPYEEAIRTFASGEVEVFPGVTAVSAHGHTPGHTTYVIHSGDETLMIWGDTVHVPEIQVPIPDVTIEFDTDKEAAIASRKRVFDLVATDKLLIAGMHLHFPGFSHLVRRGGEYVLLPEAWQQAL